MRKNIKILIASLSTLTLISTVTAITVPLVMHKNYLNNEEIDHEEFVRNMTIKSAIIDVESKLTQAIVEAGTEAKIRQIVNQTNSRNDWDSVFKFKNENDKFVTDVVSEVFFDLNTQEELAIFSINYKNDFKITNGANIVKHKVTLDIDLNITGKDEATNAVTTFLTNLLNGKNFVEQKQFYNNLNGNASVDIVNVIKDKIEFNDGNITWENAIKDVIMLPVNVFPSNPGEKIPLIIININFNKGFTTDNGSPSFGLFISNLGTAATNEITQDDVDNTIPLVTNELKRLLSDEATYDAQEVLFNNWKTTNLNNELKDIIETALNFNNLVNNITIEDNPTFPPLGSAIDIPGIKIRVTLKAGHEYLGNNSFEITTNDLGPLA